ncbi:hypothetical protein TA3x_005226 [Tundrisphaera sp. TA3]|uniref:hypothetical protein n=1 Tax=Tundrisphaera sp. TA3 TaxID=3435775 RepID=UPI003EB82EF2
MSPQAIVIHERLHGWARQLRPRLAGHAIAWVESRSAEDLARALRGAAVPIVVVDLGDAPARRLDDVALARREASDALILALDPRDRPGVAVQAREFGATRVVSGVATPPEVASIIARWLPLAGRRALACGWSESIAEPTRGATRVP